MLAHVIEGLNIYCSNSVFDGFFIRPEETRNVNKKVLLKVNKWCAENFKAFCIADIFAHLGFRYDSQFMVEEDLDLLITTFPNTRISDTALNAKQKLSNPFLVSIKNKSKRNRDGYVYLLKSNGLFKIGKSKNPSKRITDISPKFPAEVEIVSVIKTKNMDSMESCLHNKFKDKRRLGEWFNLTTEDIEYCNNLGVGEVLAQ